MFTGLPDAEICYRLNITTHTLERWKVCGITLSAGDRVAVSLGMHPLVIWKTDYWRASL